MAEREYKRLTRAMPRTSFGIITVGRSSVWVGRDHLLCIDTTGYTENYKRFFFRDIQALIIRRTKRGAIVALVLSVLTALFASFMAVAINSREAVGAWILGCLTALWLLLLVIELLRGPTCVCQIRTAVQTEELPSLGRVRRAHKVLAFLRPLVAEAQGVLAPEEVPLRMQEWLGLRSPGMTTAAPTATPFAADDPNAPPQIVS